MKSYKTVKAIASDEFTEKRSRFIGTIVPVTSEQEVQEFVTKLKKEHHDARHNVYAFVLKDGTCRYSEDGEPQGTAGMPILNVLKKNQLEDCLITVTRYFGGILLGTGGLTRAYTHAAALAVEASKPQMMKTCKEIELYTDYGAFNGVQTLILNYGKVLDSQFEEQVAIKAAILPEHMEAFSKDLTELSAGALTFSECGEILLPFEENV
ncbi:MAG: YigZ family protein [Clostridia bacterium]|nr:YigZ family protein [Clostridia bacterium]